MICGSLASGLAAFFRKNCQRTPKESPSATLRGGRPEKYLPRSEAKLLLLGVGSNHILKRKFFNKMKIILGSDEKTDLTNFISKWLENVGHEVEEVGHLIDKDKKWKWVEIGSEVGKKIAEGKADFGIVCCWSGTGVCMAVNRFRGARAALCWDVETAKIARKWNNANILCLSLRFISESIAKEILDAWFNTKFNEEGLNEAHKLEEV